MGVDFVGVAEHTFDPISLGKAKAILNSRVDALRKEFSVLEAKWGRTIRPDWQWEKEFSSDQAEANWREGMPIDLRGPAGCSVGFYRRLFTIDAARWSTFFEDMSIQAAVVRICESTVSALGGSEVIFLPDSHYPASCAFDLLLEDVTLKDVVTYLQEKCGPPANGLQDISREFSDAEMEAYRRAYPQYQMPPGFRFIDHDGYYVASVRNA